MAKRQSFADKASKKVHVDTCEVCGTSATPTMFVLPQQMSNGNIKMKKTVVKVCKCNQKQYYG